MYLKLRYKSAFYYGNDSFNIFWEEWQVSSKEINILHRLKVAYNRGFAAISGK